MTYVLGFFRFWYDFIVGDSIVLAIGGVAALLLTALCVAAGEATLAEVVLPILIITTLTLSLALRD